MVSVIFSCFASLCIGQIRHQQHKGCDKEIKVVLKICYVFAMTIIEIHKQGKQKKKLDLEKKTTSESFAIDVSNYHESMKPVNPSLIRSTQFQAP